MDEIVLRDLAPEVVARLAERAADNNRPLEHEIAHVLRQAVGTQDAAAERRREAARMAARAREIAAMTPQGIVQTDSVRLIREDRER